MTDKPEQITGSSLVEVEITFRLIVDPALRPSVAGKPYEQALEDRLYGIGDAMCLTAATCGAVGEYKHLVHREYKWRDLHDELKPDEEAPA